MVASQEDHGDADAVDVLRYYWNGYAWTSAVATQHGRIVPVSDIYYDDNVWAALDYLTARQIMLEHAARSPPLRRQATSDLGYVERVFEFLASGWSRWGGVYWGRLSWNHDLTTAATAGSGQVALELYLITHQYYYLWWARRAMSWEWRWMHSRAGLFYDSLATTGCSRSPPCWPPPTPPPPPNPPGGGLSGKTNNDPLIWLAASDS